MLPGDTSRQKRGLGYTLFRGGDVYPFDITRAILSQTLRGFQEISPAPTRTLILSSFIPSPRNPGPGRGLDVDECPRSRRKQWPETQVPRASGCSSPPRDHARGRLCHGTGRDSARANVGEHWSASSGAVRGDRAAPSRCRVRPRAMADAQRCRCRRCRAGGVSPGVSLFRQLSRRRCQAGC